MGNSYYKESQIHGEAPYELVIMTDQTKFMIGDRIKGSIFINIKEVNNMPCTMYIKVVGVESAKYDYWENGKSIYKYNITPNRFFKCKKVLLSSEILSMGYQDIPFILEPLIRSPTVCFKSRDNKLQCSIEYLLIAKIIWKQKGKRTIIERTEQPLVFFKPFIEEEEKPVEKIETITTYKWLRTSKKPVFTSLEVSRVKLMNDQHIHVKFLLDNTYGNLNIRSVKILFYLEFLLKERLFQGMPKYLIQEENFKSLKKEEFIGNTNFVIKKSDNIPHQSLGEKVGCRHIIVVQLIFEKFCCAVDDIEIIQQVEYFPDQDSEPDPQLVGRLPDDIAKRAVNHLNPEDNVEQANRPNYIKEDYFLSEETRLAHLTQIIEMK